MEKVTLKERAFVDSVAGKEQMPFFHFEPGTGWNEGVLSALQKLNELEKKKTEFYVYEVLLLLSEIWLLICKNISMPIERKKSITEIRMQTFLKHIEQHYSEDLSLADLAKSANVSKSECSRCFKQSMGTTPYRGARDKPEDRYRGPAYSFFFGRSSSGEGCE